jgi:hypothetical protein
MPASLSIANYKHISSIVALPFIPDKDIMKGMNSYWELEYFCGFTIYTR